MKIRSALPVSLRPGLPWTLPILLAACAAPATPTAREVEVLERSFQEPAARGDSRAILQKESLTLEDLLRITETIHPGLDRMRREIGRAPLEAWGDSLFPNPVLFVEVEEFPASESGNFGSSERGFGLSQTFPLFGRLGAARSVAEQQREVAALRYLWERRQVLTEVKMGFLSALIAREGVELARSTLERAQEFHGLAEKRFQARAIPEMELLKATIRLESAEVDLRRRRDELATARQTLFGLMGDVDFPARNLQGDLAVRFEIPALHALRGQVVAGHPEIRIAQGLVELARRRFDLARKQGYPDIGIELAVAWDAEEETILEGGLSVPLPIFDRNQGKVGSKEIRLAQAKLGLKESQNSAILSLTRSYRSLTNAQGRVDSYRETILPMAEKALSQTEEGYRAGKLNYLDVLDAQGTLAETRTGYLFALRDLNLAAADLERVTGSRLEGTR